MIRIFLMIFLLPVAVRSQDHGSSPALNIQNPFINYYQIVQIKPVLQRCSLNTIKHVQFENVLIAFTQTGNITAPSLQLNKYPLQEWKTNRPNTIQY